MRRLMLAVPAALAALALAAPSGASAQTAAACDPAEPLMQCVREAPDEALDFIQDCFITGWCFQLGPVIQQVDEVLETAEELCENNVFDCTPLENDQ